MKASRTSQLWAALAVAAVAAVGLTFGVSVSLAAPIEQGRFDEQSSWIVRRYCGDLRVLIDFHDQGVFVGRPAGTELFLRFTVSHHGEPSPRAASSVDGSICRSDPSTAVVTSGTPRMK